MLRRFAVFLWSRRSRFYTWLFSHANVNARLAPETETGLKYSKYHRKKLIYFQIPFCYPCTFFALPLKWPWRFFFSSLQSQNWKNKFLQIYSLLWTCTDLIKKKTNKHNLNGDPVWIKKTHRETLTPTRITSRTYRPIFSTRERERNKMCLRRRLCRLCG